MHLPRDAGPFGHRGQRRLLVALDLQPLGALGQPVQLAAQRPDHHPGQQGGEDQAGEEHERMDVVPGQVPAHRGHDDPGFEDHDRRGDEGPWRFEGDRVERDQQRDVGQLRTRDQPLDERDRCDDKEDGHRRPAPEDQREDQGRREPEVRGCARAFDHPARAQDEQPRRQDDVDQGGVATVEGPQPFPDLPGPLVPTIVPPAGHAATPEVPGTEPLGVEVT